MRNLLPAVLVLLLWFSTGSCERKAPVEPTVVTSADALIDSLRRQDATVARGDRLPKESNPFFSTNAQVLVVNGENVNVFEYGTVAAAEADAAKVSPDGSSVGSTMVAWIGPPHFYESGRLIVVYVGSAETVLRPLERVLGPPFAQR